MTLHKTADYAISSMVYFALRHARENFTYSEDLEYWMGTLDEGEIPSDIEASVQQTLRTEIPEMFDLGDSEEEQSLMDGLHDLCEETSFFHQTVLRIVTELKEESI